MEKLLDFLTAKDSISNSRLLSMINILFLLIITSNFYILWIGPYEFTFEWKAIIDYLLSGQIIISILMFVFVWIVFLLIPNGLLFLYYMKRHKKYFLFIQEGMKVIDKREQAQQFINIRKFLRKAGLGFGVLTFRKNTLLINHSFKETTLGYCKHPRYLITNTIDIFQMLLAVTVVHFWNVIPIKYFPCGLTYSFGIALIISLLVIFFLFIRFLLPFIECFVPMAIKLERIKSDQDFDSKKE